MTSDRMEYVTYHGNTADEKNKTKYAKDLLYAIFALNTAGRAKQVVKATSASRNGCEVWVRLRERFREGIGATSYVEISNFGQIAHRYSEDKWRQ